MTILLALIGAALIGYFAGAIPFGYVYVRLTKGVKLTEVGSGRTGGTNSLRAAGLFVGTLTSLSDVLKGAAAVWLTHLLLAGRLTASWLPWALAVAGVMTVVGHNWSIFLGWRGGAGTGPNVGWATAIWWPVFPVAALLLIAILLVVGMASVASLAMAAAVPLSFIVLYLAGVTPYDATLAYIAGGLAGAAIIVWSLRPNIKRLLAGNERLVGPRARRQPQKEQPPESLSE